MPLPEIRYLTKADLPAIAAIQGDASPWKPQDYLYFETWVADVPGQGVVAFVATRAVYLDEEFEVINLVVGVEHRRNGYGRLLLETVMQRRPGIWFLEVRATNHGAISLYKSLSFNQSGVRKDYYQNPPEDGIVMVRKP
ncbi:ribosomal-protein-alanine acetyltransferase [Bryobacterales bacterium F-183]|nr:ribosomal-protein-alanine acetyltransferase [Bryobacterales bacterium F-183]